MPDFRLPFTLRRIGTERRRTDILQARQHLDSIDTFRGRACAFAALLIVVLFTTIGCNAIARLDAQGPVSGFETLANPMIIPMMDRWFLMDEISDETDDYFRIFREERIRSVDGVLSEGWIETHPRIGSTLLEPWHHDSTRGFEKVHASLQTIRRYAKIRVIPTGDSYAIDVKVFKELEDKPTPIGSPIGGTILRADNALDVDQTDDWSTLRNKGWIPQGRDVSLEQRILRNLNQRLAQSPVTAAR